MDIKIIISALRKTLFKKFIYENFYTKTFILIKIK